MIKQKIKQLRREGYSYQEISNLTNLSRQYIGRVCRGVHMSAKGEARYHACVTGIRKVIKINEESRGEKIRIISNLLFDGSVFISQYHHTIMYVNSSLGLVRNFEKDMKKRYHVNPSAFEVFEGKSLPCYRIKYVSKSIYNDLIQSMPTYSTSDPACFIPPELITHKSDRVIFLRSFWDNEGSISKTGKLTADSKSHKIICQLSEFLAELNINNYVVSYSKQGYGTYYKLVINESYNNYMHFFKQNLFSKSIVTRGENTGSKKVDVLEKHIIKKYKSRTANQVSRTEYSTARNVGGLDFST